MVMKGGLLFVLFFIALIPFTLFPVSTAAPSESLITRVPGFSGRLPSKHYGGYITINQHQGKSLYYYFVTSERNPSKDPLVLWLNGGPGCSSFDGFVYEHGPFNFEKGVTAGSLPKLHLNPYSWSKVSNVIYLDSPAGVGFSFSKNSSDYITGDAKTAKDIHEFLLKWFVVYPEFQRNTFYIGGESYAGIYVPTLASIVAKGIESGLKPLINFKGYLIGNGLADKVIDGNGRITFAHGMGLISDNLFEVAKSSCNETYWAPSNKACMDSLVKIYQKFAAINIYDILEPCYHPPGKTAANYQNESLSSYQQLGKTKRPFPMRKGIFGSSWPLHASLEDQIVSYWSEPTKLTAVSCYDDRIATMWLNDKSVRSSIHAATEEISGVWQLCTDRVNYTRGSASMIGHHRNLTLKGYRALIYSGDHDLVVPFTGSQTWTRSLGYETVDEWRPWFVDDQIAGYTQGYAHNFRFLTIKGAGHTVPQKKPEESLTFYSRWLSGQSP